MGYTFNITPYGTVEVFENGVRKATTTDAGARLNYGYGGTPGATPIAPSLTPAIVNTQAPAPVSAAPVDTNLQLKQGESPDQYNTRVAAYRTSMATTPPVSNIPNPVKPPTSTGTGAGPVLPTPSAPNTIDQFNSSVATSLEASRVAVENEAKRRAADYQVKIDAIESENLALKNGEKEALQGAQGSTQNTTAQKRAALDLEKQRVDENYNANQSLINEMDSLLTTGNKVIEQMKQTTGLASIMSPRISQTISDVTARTGIIQTLISARNGQIGVAQNQLASTVSTLESIAADEMNYYKTLLSYYTNRRDSNDNKLLSLTKDQKDYLDVKINSLSADMENTRETAKIIQRAMVDPQTATAYAKAGVSLRDTPEQIADKLSKYDYSQEVANISNTMAEKGYSSTKIAGVTPVTITDTNGVTRDYYRAATNEDGGFTLGNTRFDAQGNVIASVPYQNGGSTLTERNQLIENQAVVDLYGSFVLDALSEDATAEEAVLAAVAIAKASGTNLSLQEQGVLLTVAKDALNPPANSANTDGKIKFNATPFPNSENDIKDYLFGLPQSGRMSKNPLDQLSHGV